MKRAYTQLPYTEYPTLAYDSEVQRLPIAMIILHSTAGTYESSISYFNNPKAGTSAHYIIANDGRLAGMLEEYNVAFHSGSYEVNRRSIGIEHEGYSGMVRKDSEYTMSAKLVADICKFYNIPCNRDTVKPHREIVPTACPTDLDIDRIIREANVILKGVSSLPTTPMDNNNVKKATQVDKSLNFLKDNNYITDNNSNNYLDGQFYNLVVRLYNELVSNKGRASNWDKLCLLAGITGDSKKVTPEELQKALKGTEIDIEKIKVEAYQQGVLKQREKTKKLIADLLKKI